MSWFQKQFTLPAKSRGSYLITDQVVGALPEIKQYKVGLLNLFVQHTSCALSLNENWDSDVREDMSNALDRIAPEAGPKGEELYLHSAEGPDDMPVRHSAKIYEGILTVLGPYQVRSYRCKRHHPYQGRKASYRNMAGNLVFGIQSSQAPAPDRCDHPGREVIVRSSKEGFHDE